MILKLFTVALSVLAAPLWAMEMESVYGNNSNNNPGQHSPLLGSHARVGTRFDSSSILQDRSVVSMQPQPYSVGNNNNNYSTSVVPMPVRSSRTSVGDYTGFQDPARGLLVKNFMDEFHSLGKEANNLVGINYRDMNGNTSLHVAVAYIADNFSSLEFCKEFIADGADVTVLNNQGESALALAKRFGEREVACYLQTHLDELLGSAAQQGSIEWIAKSIAAGADVNAQNSFGETPLARAAFHGHLDICTVLTGYGARLESEQQAVYSSLSASGLNDQVSNLQLFELQGNNQLITAIKRGNVEWVKRCIDRDVDINNPNMFGALPLHEAVVQKNIEICYLLLANGADVTAQDAKRKTPFDLVDESESLNSREIKILLQLYLDRKLIAAVKNGDAQKVENLIAAHANVNAVDSSNEPALFLAVCGRHKKIVQALIKHDADINKDNDYGNTPLIAAAFVGDESIAEILLKKRAGKKSADIDHQNLVKSSALIVAASKGFEGLARLLVEKGANTELHDESNETALVHAESRGFAAIAQLLSAKSRATDSWISANTKQCPKCPCRWMKDPSCDKMTCGSLTKESRYGGCGAQWCWQCGKDWRLTCNHHVYTQPVVHAAREQLTYKNLTSTALNVVIAGGIGYMGSKLLAVSWIGLNLVNNNTLKLGLKDPKIPVVHAPLTRSNGNATPTIPQQGFICGGTPMLTQPVATAPVEVSIYGPIEPPVLYESSEQLNPKIPKRVGNIPTNSFSLMSLSKLFSMDAFKFSKWKICPEFANAKGCLFTHVHKKLSANGTCYATVHKNFNITWNDYLVKMATAQTVLPSLEIPEWVIEYISTTNTNIDWSDYVSRMTQIGQPIPQWVMDIIEQ